MRFLVDTVDESEAWVVRVDFVDTFDCAMGVRLPTPMDIRIYLPFLVDTVDDSGACVSRVDFFRAL